MDRRSLWLLATVLALVLLLGCGGSAPTSSSSPSGSRTTTAGVTTTTGARATATTVTAASPTTAATTGTTTTEASTESTEPESWDVALINSDSIEYARRLGGTSHEGETLYFAIGASVTTEAEAKKLLVAAIPLFGDMQTYFIVQRSDNFEGMTPGYWVVFEAYHNPPGENLALGARAFHDIYVKRAIVRTSDPIPVYEDILGLSDER